jgi:hypothetical protein
VLEAQAISFISKRVAKGTTINADEASSWDGLHDRFEMKRINHQVAYSMEALARIGLRNFSAVCAAPKSVTIIIISGAYLLRYAQEATWREYLVAVVIGQEPLEAANPQSPVQTSGRNAAGRRGSLASP